MKTDRIPPHSLEAEESVLSACMLGHAEEAVEILEPDDFYKTAHQIIFKAVCELVKANSPADLVMVVTQLRDSEELEKVGGATYLHRVVDEAPIASNIEHYATTVKEKAALRQAIERCHRGIQSCYRATDACATIDQIQQSINEVEVSSGSGATSYRSLTVEAGRRYEELKKNPSRISGIPSGFGDLDWLTCGFQPSDLIILAARPSMGKTALALNMVNLMALQGISVAFFSLEMSKEQLHDRTLASMSGVSAQKFRSGAFEKGDWEHITNAQGRIYGMPVHIDDQGSLHYLEIKRRLRRYVKQHGVELAVVDHLQLVRGDNTGTRDREIGSITAGLKAAAKELKIPIILLSQLNRSLETRHDKRPQLSDLRDSGNIEQDADLVMLLYRPGAYGIQQDYEGQTELIIGKQRNGPTRMVELMWNPIITKFVSLARN